MSRSLMMLFIVSLLLVTPVALAQSGPDRSTPPKVDEGMVEVPAGEFTMGSNDGDSDEKPVRRVYLDAYSIDKTEVTVASYRQCVDAGDCTAPVKTHSDLKYFNWGASGRDQHPINGVNWHQAKAYCKWAGKRLPTEAEWEKAARGTDGRKYPWGHGRPTCSRTVMYDGGLGCGRDETWPVGSKLAGASPYGALDMAGNVWEWTADWYDDSYDASSTRNPRGPSRGSRRVRRGGGFYLDAAYLRASDRLYDAPSDAFYYLGFRCARSGSP